MPTATRFLSEFSKINAIDTVLALAILEFFFFGEAGQANVLNELI